MPDMLVKLYDLPVTTEPLSAMQSQGIVLRRAIAPEKRLVVSWVRHEFGLGWGDECEVAFARVPVSCFIAQEAQRILGFACYDATAKAFFGPTGVDEHERGRGIGGALLLAALQAMAAEGYAYGIIGGAGPTEFYAKMVHATVIEGSVPGIYRGMLRE